jgi:hypothetical protein
MTFLHTTLLAILALASTANAQQAWDEMDVIDGPNPTLRYGFYSEPSGQLMMGRYYFVDDGENLKVRLAPFGKTAIELPVLNYDRNAGSIELGWEGKPDRRCKLERHGESLFLGNCLEQQKVMPLAIRVANKFDSEWQGANFPISAVDIAILDRARQLLVVQEQRNLSGDRNCDDDIQLNELSIFCALYVASLEIDGVYRHRRPVMNEVRYVLLDRYPGDYMHLLRDVNNRTDISDQALIGAFDSARDYLTTELAKQ